MKKTFLALFILCGFTGVAQAEPTASELKFEDGDPSRLIYQLRAGSSLLLLPWSQKRTLFSASIDGSGQWTTQALLTDIRQLTSWTSTAAGWVALCYEFGQELKVFHPQNPRAGQIHWSFKDDPEARSCAGLAFGEAQGPVGLPRVLYVSDVGQQKIRVFNLLNRQVEQTILTRISGPAVLERVGQQLLGMQIHMMIPRASSFFGFDLKAKQLVTGTLDGNDSEFWGSRKYLPKILSVNDTEVFLLQAKDRRVERLSTPLRGDTEPALVFEDAVYEPSDLSQAGACIVVLGMKVVGRNGDFEVTEPQLSWLRKSSAGVLNVVHQAQYPKLLNVRFIATTPNERFVTLSRPGQIHQVPNPRECL